MDLDFLSSVSIFSDLSDSELSNIKTLCQTRKYPKNSMIILEEEMGDVVFIVMSVMSSNFKCFAKFSDVEGKGKPQDRSIRETNIERWFQKRKSQFGVMCYLWIRCRFNLFVFGNTSK